MFFLKFGTFDSLYRSILKLTSLSFVIWEARRYWYAPPPALTYDQIQDNFNHWGFWFALGTRGTKHLVYLLSILQGSRTDIWSFRIHVCYWYVVRWLCYGRDAFRAGMCLFVALLHFSKYETFCLYPEFWWLLLNTRSLYFPVKAALISLSK